MSSHDESEILTKRSRLHGSAKKNWSLTDSKADEEVLQEMGVSVLDSDESEAQVDVDQVLIKPGCKRKYDLENVNPNSLNTSAHKSPRPSPKRSPRKALTPIAGPSFENMSYKGDWQNYNVESDLVLHQLDEETPECGFRVDRQLDGHTPRGTDVKKPQRETEPVYRRKESPPPTGPDSFSALSDEMMVSIFKWLPKRTLAHCMCVCKRWLRVASDETFWQRLELGNRVIHKDALGRILDRKPLIVRLAGSEIGSWHPEGPIIQSRIQYLDLSMCSIDETTLVSLLSRCHGLKKLSVESVAMCEDACVAIGNCSKLETLNLTMATGITTEGVRAILQGCPCIQSLNISWCNLAADSLNLLGDSLPHRLQRLNLAGARVMNDEMLSRIVERCRHLVELDVSDCGRVCGDAVRDITRLLDRLEHLALSRCYLLPPHALTKLNCMPSLQYLEVWGMLQESSLSALRATLPTIQINQFMHSAIARPTVGARRTSIWGLRTRD